MHSRSSSVASFTSSIVLDSPASVSSAESNHTRDTQLSHIDGQSFDGSPKSYIMVIGGAGYIGSHTTLELLKAGYNVVVVDDLSNSYRTVLDRIRQLASKHRRSLGLRTPALNFHKLDYRSPMFNNVLGRYTTESRASRESRSQISGVIHFAAFKSVEESQSRPLDYYLNNVCGLVELLVKLGDHGIFNFVFSSSATVYGIKANDGRPLQEMDLVHHPDLEGEGQEGLVAGIKGLTNPYGRTKFVGEMILADVARANPAWRITALRYFNPVGCDPSGILGEDPRNKPTNLFPIISQVLTDKRQGIDVFGSDYETTDGTAVRDFIHVVDLAEGHVAAIEHAVKRPASQAFRTYNLGTGTGYTVSEVIGAMETASGKVVPQRRVGRRAGDVGYCVAATDRAAQELNWQTKRSLEQCASDVWRHLQATT